MNQSIGQTQYWTRGNTVPPPPPPPLVTPLLQFSLSLNIIPDLLFLTCPLGATVESAAPVCHPTESSDISTTATHQVVVHSLYYWTPTSMLFEQFTSHFLSTLSPDIKWVILTVRFLILRLTTRPCFWVESLNSTVSVHTTKTLLQASTRWSHTVTAPCWTHPSYSLCLFYTYTADEPAVARQVK